MGRSAGTIKALISALEDEDTGVREIALVSLRSFSPLDTENVSHLAGVLKSRRQEVRRLCRGRSDADRYPRSNSLECRFGGRGLNRAGRGSGGPWRIAPKAAVARLSEAMLKESNRELRSNIAQALVRIGPDAKESVPALSQMLRQKDSEARKCAATVLAAIGPEGNQAATDLIDAFEDRSVIDPVSDALASIGKPAVPVLIKALTDRRPNVRLGVVVALGKVGPNAQPAVLALSRRVTEDRHSEIRSAARISLRRIQQQK